MFLALSSSKASVDGTAVEWMNAYREDPISALAVLFNFMLRVGGAQADHVVAADLETDHSCPSQIERAEEEFEPPASGALYPLSTEGRAVPAMVGRFREFWGALLGGADEDGLLWERQALFGEDAAGETPPASAPGRDLSSQAGDASAAPAPGLVPYILDFALALSTCRLRPFRVCGTAAVLGVAAGLGTILMERVDRFNEAAEATDKCEARLEKTPKNASLRASLEALSASMEKEEARVVQAEAWLVRALTQGMAMRCRDSHAEVRRASLRGFEALVRSAGRLPMDEHLTPVLLALTDPHAGVRTAALSALVEVAAQGASAERLREDSGLLLDTLFAMLDDVEPSVAARAVDAVSRLSAVVPLSPAQRDRLLRGFWDTDEAVRTATGSFALRVLLARGSVPAGDGAGAVSGDDGADDDAAAESDAASTGGGQDRAALFESLSRFVAAGAERGDGASLQARAAPVAAAVFRAAALQGGEAWAVASDWGAMFSVALRAEGDGAADADADADADSDADADADTNASKRRRKRARPRKSGGKRATQREDDTEEGGAAGAGGQRRRLLGGDDADSAAVSTAALLLLAALAEEAQGDAGAGRSATCHRAALKAAQAALVAAVEENVESCLTRFGGDDTGVSAVMHLARLLRSAEGLGNAGALARAMSHEFKRATNEGALADAVEALAGIAKGGGNARVVGEAALKGLVDECLRDLAAALRAEALHDGEAAQAEEIPAAAAGERGAAGDGEEDREWDEGAREERLVVVLRRWAALCKGTRHAREGCPEWVVPAVGQLALRRGPAALLSTLATDSRVLQREGGDAEAELLLSDGAGVRGRDALVLWHALEACFGLVVWRFGTVFESARALRAADIGTPDFERVEAAAADLAREQQVLIALCRDTLRACVAVAEASAVAEELGPASADGEADVDDDLAADARALHPALRTALERYARSCSHAAFRTTCSVSVLFGARLRGTVLGPLYYRPCNEVLTAVTDHFEEELFAGLSGTPGAEAASPAGRKRSRAGAAGDGSGSGTGDGARAAAWATRWLDADMRSTDVMSGVVEPFAAATVANPDTEVFVASLVSALGRYSGEVDACVKGALKRAKAVDFATAVKGMVLALSFDQGRVRRLREDAMGRDAQFALGVVGVREVEAELAKAAGEGGELAKAAVEEESDDADDDDDDDDDGEEEEGVAVPKASRKRRSGASARAARERARARVQTRAAVESAQRLLERQARALARSLGVRQLDPEKSRALFSELYQLFECEPADAEERLEMGSLLAGFVRVLGRAERRVLARKVVRARQEHDAAAASPADEAGSETGRGKGGLSSSAKRGYTTLLRKLDPEGTIAAELGATDGEESAGEADRPSKEGGRGGSGAARRTPKGRSKPTPARKTPRAKATPASRKGSAKRTPGTAGRSSAATPLSLSQARRSALRGAMDDSEDEASDADEGEENDKPRLSGRRTTPAKGKSRRQSAASSTRSRKRDRRRRPSVDDEGQSDGDAAPVGKRGRGPRASASTAVSLDDDLGDAFDGAASLASYSSQHRF